VAYAPECAIIAIAGAGDWGTAEYIMTDFIATSAALYRGHIDNRTRQSISMPK
jgi:hypothetical protein